MLDEKQFGYTGFNECFLGALSLQSTFDPPD